jgi:hypothetical protein
VDGTVFVVEASNIEAFRSNQKVANLPTAFTPSSISVTASLMAVGGEVHDFLGKETDIY